MPQLDSGSESDTDHSSAESEIKSPSPAGSRRGSHSRNASPALSEKSVQSNLSNASRNKSQSNSPRSHRSRSSSGHSRHSRHSGSESGSPNSRKSVGSDGSKSKKLARRPKSPSEAGNSPKSASQSPKSPDTSVKSRSQSPRSRSPSQESVRSRKSKSPSPRSHKSASKSPSGSPNVAQDSRSNTPDLQIDDARRSRSRSHSSQRSSKSGSSAVKPISKKRAVLSDSDASENEAKDLQQKRKHSITSNGDSGSDNNSQKPTKKKPKPLIDSESENEEKGADKSSNVVTADALFGDASDISSEDEDKADDDDKRSSSPRRQDSDSDKGSDKDEARRSGSEERRSGDEAETNEPEVEPAVETRIDADIPKITTDLGKEIHFIKLPNFLSVETRPFDQETYEDEIDEEETLDEEGRARLKLKVENTIRWRTDFDRSGDLIKESNARFIKWSDGSMSLHLGAEIFDVYKQPLHGDFNHLFVRQGSGLLGQAVFRTKLTFRPHSTESFTHRKMTLSLADRSQKTSGIKILSQVGVDPDQDRQYQLKKEEQELRASMRSKGSTGRVTTGRRNTRGDGANRRTAGDDGSDDEGTISLQAIKNKYKSGQPHKPAGDQIYSSDEETSDVDARRARRLDRAKVLQDSEEEGDSRSEEENKQTSRSRSGSRSPTASHHSGSESEE